MVLLSPVVITPRLLPGVKIGGGFVAIEKDGMREGRTRYRYYLDDGELAYSSNDLSSGVGGGTLQEGLNSLLSFLSAAGKLARGRIMPTCFPPQLWNGRVSIPTKFPCSRMSWSSVRVSLGSEYGNS